MADTLNLNFNFKDFYQLTNNNILINARLFHKLPDYTDLITHIITITNECLKLRSDNNYPLFFKICIDLHNVKLKNADYDFLKMLIPFLENAYPDNLEKMYFHNTPFIFKTVYTIIRNFIHKDTRKKIIFVKNKNKLNIMDIELAEDKLEELF